MNTEILNKTSKVLKKLDDYQLEIKTLEEKHIKSLMLHQENINTQLQQVIDSYKNNSFFAMFDYFTSFLPILNFKSIILFSTITISLMFSKLFLFKKTTETLILAGTKTIETSSSFISNELLTSANNTIINYVLNKYNTVEKIKMYTLSATTLLLGFKLGKFK